MKPKTLREYKEARELSGRGLAREVGVSETYLSQILAGQRTMSKKLALNISKKTGIPILNLLYPSGFNEPGARG